MADSKLRTESKEFAKSIVFTFAEGKIITFAKGEFITFAQANS